MKKIPIVVCNIGSPAIDVMIASAKCYAPDNPLLIHYMKKSTFGESYNIALNEAFEEYDEVIVANDDIVLGPHSLNDLVSDVEKLKPASIAENFKLGFVAAMHDSSRPGQNIRFQFFKDDQIEFGKWRSESMIKMTPVIAPIFAYLSKEAFQAAPFAPITWYSDDVICEDLNKLGFKHFISTSYVHHVGSTSVGNKYDVLREEAMPWIRENRPEYLQELENRLSFKQGSI